MLLSERIQDLFDMMEAISSIFINHHPVTRRMLAISFITEMHQIEAELSVINDRLDTEISVEDAFINKDAPYLTHKNIMGLLKDVNSYYVREEGDVLINHVIDSFPLGQKDYAFTSEKADTFKTGMRHICSDTLLEPRDIVYAISNGIKNIYSLLLSIINNNSSVKI